MTSNIQPPIFHGMRSKKSAEQLKKEGFCSYGSSVDEKKAVVDALKHFNKEKFLHGHGHKSFLIKREIEHVMDKRRSTYATVAKEAPCNWWARANPENISLVLGYVGVKEKDVDKYLGEKYGKNCYNVELDLKLSDREKEELKYNQINFNTGKRCIKPSEIKDVKKCKSCEYTYKAVENNE